MKIVIGLGNPGKKYALNRHNVGFSALDELAQKEGVNFNERKLFNAELAPVDHSLLLAKPNTYMNDSGLCVKQLLKQYDGYIAIVHDDVDINLGSVKCSFARGSGGHNGVQSIIDHIGTNEFFRIRIGVRPVHEELLSRIDPPDGFQKFLLSDFAPFEKELKEKGIERAIEIIQSLKESGIEEIMNKFN